MSKTIYEKNLEALIGIDPLLGSALFSIRENSQFEVFQGKDPIDINIIDIQTHAYLYANPINDLEHHVSSIEERFSRHCVLFFYGIGSGLMYKLLSANSVHKHIVIFEPELELIYIALNLVDISEALTSEQIIIQYTKTLSFAHAIKLVYKADIKPYVRLYDLHLHALFYERYEDDIHATNQLLIRAFKQMVVSHGNDTKDALIGIEQHLYNFPFMLQNYTLDSVLKSPKNSHAVIISTGPSLHKQLPLLKEYAPYMRLICIDASLPILQAHGIIPDVVVSMERVELTSQFFKTLLPEVLEHTLFVVSSLTHPNTIQNLAHAKVALAMRPLAYMRYFEMPQFGYVGSGMSAANLGFQMAYLMKHKNIILIGQDLAYAKDGKSHAKGHIFSEEEIKQSPHDLFVTGYGGGDVVKTTFVWDMFRNFFEKDIEFTNKHSIQTYNCTQGGARIHGAIEKDFKQVLEEIVCKKSPKKALKPKRIKQNQYLSLLAFAYQKTQEMITFGMTFKEEIEALFTMLMHTMEQYEKTSLAEVDFEELLELTLRIDAIKETVEGLEFSKMYLDTVQSFVYHQELELAKIVVENVETNEQKKEKLMRWLVAHKYWLFSLAGGIEAQLLALTRGRTPLMQECRKWRLI